MPRPLDALPKAHLHLHFTGSRRHATLVELAARHRISLPEALVKDWPPRLSGADERGWFRFQRLYDIARSVLRTPADVRRLILETAQDECAEGSAWLELQVDPSARSSCAVSASKRNTSAGWRSTERAMSYSRWNRNQPRSSVPLSRGGHAAASASGR